MAGRTGRGVRLSPAVSADAGPVPGWPPSAKPGFDPARAGKRAECEGGMVSDAGQASRDDFAGRLTGLYVDHGTPPQRWYLMTDLTRKPPDYTEDAVWCETGFLFVEGEEE